MHRPFTTALGATALLYMASSAAMAQNAPPTYQADPSVYKIILENENYRVIEAIRKPGVHDKVHSHPVPSVVIELNDCTGKLYNADGTTKVNNNKAGDVSAVPIIASHSAENIGATVCHEIFVERK